MLAALVHLKIYTNKRLDLFKFKNISSSMKVNVLKIILRFLLATCIFTLEFIWSLQVRFWSIITPRFFSLSTFSSSISWLFDAMEYMIPLSCLPMYKWWHHMILKSILHIFFQLATRFRLFWTLVSTIWLDTTAYILASSANNFINTSITSGKSLMLTRNNTGPWTLPWGIPLVMSFQDVCEPFTLTLCSLDERNSLIQLRF